MLGLVGYPETWVATGLVGYPQPHPGFGLVGPLFPGATSPGPLFPGATPGPLFLGVTPGGGTDGLYGAGAADGDIGDRVGRVLGRLFDPSFLFDFRVPAALGRGLASTAWNAFTLPGDAYAGRVDLDSDEGFSRVMDLAGMVTLGPAGKAAAGRLVTALDNPASRSPMLYDPPTKPPRPFEADYPGGAPADEAGNLKVDIDEKPLIAKHVVGRRVVGGEDQALSPAEYDSVAEGLFGTVPKAVAARALPRGAAGAFRRVAGPDGPEYQLGVLKTLPPGAAAKVTAHEIAHGIDEFAGLIDTTGLNSELESLYSTLATGAERTRHKTLPRHRGYAASQVPRELIAEAIRAYMADPNFIKTVAPKTAAAIRKAWNENPRHAKTIQFNLGGVPIGTADGSGGAEVAPQPVMPGEVY